MIDDRREREYSQTPDAVRRRERYAADPVFRDRRKAYNRLKTLRKSPRPEWLEIMRENREINWKRGVQRCVKCGKVKPLDKNNFPVAWRNKTGFLTRCRDCHYEFLSTPEYRAASRKRAIRSNARRRAKDNG